jgi:hypothetical protein
MGSDAIPAQIDGVRVYSVTDQAAWQNLSGSFLMAAYPILLPQPSGAGRFGQSRGTPTPEANLLGGSVLLSGTASFKTVGGPTVAPKSPAPSLYGWANHAVVLRVHTHDPEAAACMLDMRAQCEAAVVVEALVWPTVPAEIDGQHVYRASDLGSLIYGGTYHGSFLLGGVVSVESSGSPCTPNAPKTEQQLLWFCQEGRLIDGWQIAPISNLDAVDGEIVVARAHVNDALAAQCSATYRSSCELAVVVESVVWSSDPYSPVTATPAVPSPTDSAT